MQGLAAAHWEAAQAAESAAGRALVQPGDSLSVRAAREGVFALAHLPMWCPQLATPPFLALAHQKLSCQLMVSGQAAAAGSHLPMLTNPAACAV